MPRLLETELVDRPSEECLHGFEKFLDCLRDKGGICRLRLRVPVTSNPGGLCLDRTVFVEARRTPRAEPHDDMIRITWIPEGSIVFPRFEGVLIFRSDEANPSASCIELNGWYVPPLGPAGQIFDAAIGQRIAHATAREFLKDVKRLIEREPKKSSPESP